MKIDEAIKELTLRIGKSLDFYKEHKDDLDKLFAVMSISAHNLRVRENGTKKGPAP